MCTVYIVIIVYCDLASVFIFHCLRRLSLLVSVLLCLFINVNKPSHKDDFHENLPYFASSSSFSPSVIITFTAIAQ